MKINDLIIILLLLAASACLSSYQLGFTIGEKTKRSDKAKMEEMINVITSHKGAIIEESAMVWRAYVLDYGAYGMTAEEATYELLKVFEMGETDSLTISD